MKHRSGESVHTYFTRVRTGIGGIRLLALANRNLVLQAPPPASYFMHYAFCKVRGGAEASDVEIHLTWHWE